MSVSSSALNEAENAGIDSSETDLSLQALPASQNKATEGSMANTADNKGLEIGEKSEQHDQKTKPQRIYFGESNTGLQAGIVNGDIHGISFHYAESQSIFGSLTYGTHPLDSSTLDILARRTQVQAGRKVSSLLINNDF